jgi:2-dehydro-3-deoxyphosphogluconate aldolase / (4S)-4-hydroxy-2-oxoglutarate aldolase
MSQIETILKQCSVIPVITVREIDSVLPLAETLVTSGFTTLEITLRTEISYRAIELIAQKLPHVCVGAGTVLNPQQLLDAKKRGAQFAVSPGFSQMLVNIAKHNEIPYLPGAVTATEMLLAYESNLTAVKFFPAKAMGGAETIRSLAEVFPKFIFCPTGGINLTNIKDYLALPSIPCVGGTWLVPQKLISEKNWSAIKKIAKETQDVLSQSK